MEIYYSKVEEERILHMVKRLHEIVVDQDVDRVDIVTPENFIQCSALKMKKGKTFKPHKHIFKKRTYEKQIAQESWIVIKGSVKCIFYDIDDKIIAEPILYAGDACFTLGGGHNYLILEDDTIVYEYKTGPYEGQALDKVFIENKLSKDIILEYIIKQFGNETSKENRLKHYSYCLFPEKSCCCKDLNKITYDTSLINGGYIDSFSMVSVLVFLEKSFGIKIPEKLATPNNFNTVNKMVELLNSLK